jgi:hypothetical protein
LGKSLDFDFASERVDKEKIRANIAIRLGENFLINFILNSSGHYRGY